MAAGYVQLHDLGLTVYGQAQYDFSVGDVVGLSLGEAALASAFKYTMSYEDEMLALQDNMKVRQQAISEISSAMTSISSALAADDKSNKDPNDKLSDKAKQYVANVETVLKKYEINLPDSKDAWNLNALTYGQLQKWQSAVKTSLQTEQNGLQQACTTMKSIISKHDSAVETLAKVQKKAEAPAATIIRNIGQ